MKKFLTAITTFSSPAYIDLSLKYLTFIGKKDSDFIVCDDCSNDKRLQEICDSYNVPLLTLDKKAPCSDIGDISLMLKAMKYANENGYEFLVKMSRKWICKRSPFESLNYLIEHSDGSTYSNNVARYNYGFNTACICYRMKEWSTKINEIQNKIDEWSRTNPKPEFLRVEGFMHKLAKQLQPQTDKYITYQRIHYSEPDSAGYVKWDWISYQQHRVPPYILWHDDTSPEDYYNESLNIGLSNFKLEDFK